MAWSSMTAPIRLCDISSRSVPMYLITLHIHYIFITYSLPIHYHQAVRHQLAQRAEVVGEEQTRAYDSRAHDLSDVAT